MFLVTLESKIKISKKKKKKRKRKSLITWKLKLLTFVNNPRVQRRSLKILKNKLNLMEVKYSIKKLVCMLVHSVIWLSAQPWTQSLTRFLCPMELLRARILECIDIQLCRGSSSARGVKPGLLHYKQILLCITHQEASKIGEYNALFQYWEGNLYRLTLMCILK